LSHSTGAACPGPEGALEALALVSMGTRVAARRTTRLTGGQIIMTQFGPVQTRYSDWGPKLDVRVDKAAGTPPDADAPDSHRDARARASRANAFAALMLPMDDRFRPYNPAQLCYFSSDMPSATTNQVLEATQQWLRPLIHVLLSCGITWREFAELSRTTYVQVASENFGKRGRPTNVSRTAILTGLARRDVRKQRQLLAQAPKPLTGYVTKASLVLSAWHLNPKFRDKKGRPAVLRVQGPGKTFSALIESAGGTDVKPSTLLKELVSAGAVRVRADGRLQALLRDYIPRSMDEQLIRLWGTVIADVATTYVHNLTRKQNASRRLERSAVNQRIPLSAVPEFVELLEREGQKFLERIDTWLTSQQRIGRAGKEAEQTLRLGVGLYQIQD
jgi:hypothetical protein